MEDVEITAKYRTKYDCLLYNYLFALLINCIRTTIVLGLNEKNRKRGWVKVAGLIPDVKDSYKSN